LTRRILHFVPLLLFPLLAAAQTVSKDPWAGMKFLIGEFAANDSTGQPGSASSGGFTLQPDLGGTVFVRKNHAEYSVTKDRPAFTHEDLMIVYRENGALEALYNDSEGHVIHYDVSTPDPKQIVFLSQPGSGPQFRLTYADLGGGAVNVLFEIAPPDQPGKFTKYVEATVHRKR
jgi:hypothetical protein